MDNIFIGWSGNLSLAEQVASLINNNSPKKAIVGGGVPKDMFIGAQVLNQIDRSNYALLLVEDKDNGQISHNLMFEWGYIAAKLSVNNICTILINKSSRELPSDLLGTWVFELNYDRKNETEEQFANKIFDIVQRSFGESEEKNYFNLIDRWNQVFVRMQTTKIDNDQEMAEYLLLGSLAAYYYMDNIPLRKFLNNISGSVALNEIVNFVKGYTDLFIESANMTKPLTQDSVFNLMQIYESTLASRTHISEEIDILVEILCNDVYGLACSLFLKNDGLDQETIEFFSKKALECYDKALSLIDEFTKKNNSICLWQLLYSYLYNDLAQLYHHVFNDMDKFKSFLALAVENRKKLHQTFSSIYPNNQFLITKFEQEYIIALSEQCNYMEESFMKTMYKKTILSKFTEWQKELIYTSSLTDRIEANIQKINK